MRNITIVGAGQSGLQLGLGLLQNGYRVRLISNRTAQDFATGKVMSSQFMFNDALQAERDLGINFWEKECPNTDGLGVTIGAPDGSKAAAVRGGARDLRPTGGAAPLQRGPRRRPRSRARGGPPSCDRRSGRRVRPRKRRG